MSESTKSKIPVEATLSAPVNQVWTAYTSPRHIVKWNAASEDWHSPHATNELEPGGSFSYRMEAKNGSMGFDFEGVFQEVKPNEFLSYVISDGRKAEVTFQTHQDKTTVKVLFEAEKMNSEELQRQGWQAILDHFKSYVEGFQQDSLHFEISIEAPVNKVFTLMLEDKSYREWTYPFSPGSHYKGSWEKGSKILFLAENGIDGMVSRIADRIENQYISIEHLGFLAKGEEITSGPEIEAFAGVTENYTFINLGEKTKLMVDMESGGEYRDHFLKIWPQALEVLKQICER